MDNEETRLINDETSQNEQPVSESQSRFETTEHKKSKRGIHPGASAGGFIAGAAVGIGATAFASNTPKEATDPEKINAVENPETEAPAPEQAILANDEGIRYAHIEADNFNDAFAQARAQVGPGGVFEYDGRLYGTYLADEWNEMTPQERADYQSRVNEVASSHQSALNVSNESGSTGHHESASNETPTNAEMISEEPVDNEIRVLGVEAVQNDGGQIMNVALVECEGDHALLVDVDNNGTMDVLLHDDNGDGNLQESEVHDISGAGLDVADLVEAQAAQQGDMLYAADDNMPDYINDADSIMSV